MMKIQSPSQSLVEKSLAKDRLLLKTDSINKKRSFHKELKNSQNEQTAKKLKSFLEEIDKEGDRLLTLRTLDSLTRYKELIKNFLKEVLKNLYLLNEKVDFSPKGKHKIFVIISCINKNLEDLVKMVLNKEIPNLKILEKLGEIKGLLIDLYS